jgi:hypothetical protein
VSPETAKHYNRLSHMSEKEREEAIAREVFGGVPLVSDMFPGLAKPKDPRTDADKRRESTPNQQYHGHDPQEL